MTKRWKQRPEGSTWGDWGENDELGRINLLTPEKVLQGVREVEAGISFSLSLPLDFPGGTALNQRRYPPRLAPTEDLDGNPEVFYNVHQKDIPKYGSARHVDVWADDQVTLWLQYSTQWDSLAHAGAEFDADGDGVEEAVYYNGYRAGVDLVGPKHDAEGNGGNHACFAKHLGLEHMAFHGVQGRGVLIDLVHHLGHEFRGVDRATLEEIMAADNVVVEPGDMVLFHTGFATEVLEVGPQPRSGEDPRDVHVPRRARSGDARVDHRVADLRVGRRQLRGRRSRRRTAHRRPALVAADPPPLPLQARRPARRDVVLARAGNLAARAQPEPLPAHRSPAPPARRGRLSAHPDRDRLTATSCAERSRRTFATLAS